jgi:hypothetical protein
VAEDIKNIVVTVVTVTIIIMSSGYHHQHHVFFNKASCRGGRGQRALGSVISSAGGLRVRGALLLLYEHQHT